MTSNALILANAAILDLEDGALHEPRDILVENGRIADIEAGFSTGADLPRIDLGGKIAMPGLCDGHVHVTALSADLPSLRHLPPSYVTSRAIGIMNDMLMRGFTTVRDAGGADFGLARAVEEGLIDGPRLLFCEKALSQTGGHSDMRSAGENELFQCPCCSGIGHVCDGVSEMRRACRDVVRKGATQIKLMISGGIASPTDKLTSDQFADDEIEAAVQEARAAGIYCMAHAYTPRAIMRAARAGVRSIEHGNLLDQEAADVMRECGTYLVPTLVTYQALASEGAASGLAPDMCAKVDQVLNAGLEALDIAVKTGLPIVYGSDLLGTMQRHQLREFEIRSAVQSPLDILRGATTTAASLFNMEGEIGALVPGASADLLVLDTDPREDISVLQSPEANLKLIMARGRIMKNILD